MTFTAFHDVVNPFHLPAHAVEPWVRMTELSDRQHKGYVTVTVSLPRRPRTIGYRSQNHRLNGYCQIIAQETGNDFDTVKSCVKRRALSRGYPGETDPDGELVPLSEALSTVEQCSLLIEMVEQLAAELSIVLPEYPDEV